MRSKPAKLLELERLLCPIIEHHLPTAAQRGFRNWRSASREPEPRSCHYALHLGMAKSMGPQTFGQTDAEVSLTEVRRALEDSRRKLAGLDGGRRLQLSVLISPGARLSGGGPISSIEDSLLMASTRAGGRRASGTGSGFVTPNEVAQILQGHQEITQREAEFVSEVLIRKGWLELFEATLEMAASELRDMEKEHRGEPKASRKPNWRAASVADKCRMIWAQEHRESGSKEWCAFCDGRGSQLGDAGRTWNFAPMQQHHDTPGPFGRLLNDILAALNIMNSFGEPVSAAVALRQWKKAVEARQERRKHED